jgi:hypothetical protein
MFVRWLSRKSSATARWRRNKVHWSAILVESVRVKGKPTQRHIAYLAGIDERWLDKTEQANVSAQWRFWEQVTRKLDDLSKQVSAEDRRSIETAIAKKVPCPTRKQYDGWKRQALALLGPEWVRPAVKYWPLSNPSTSARAAVSNKGESE